jgi:hypothetical protein
VHSAAGIGQRTALPAPAAAPAPVAGRRGWCWGAGGRSVRARRGGPAAATGPPGRRSGGGRDGPRLYRAVTVQHVACAFHVRAGPGCGRGVAGGCTAWQGYGWPGGRDGRGKRPAGVRECAGRGVLAPTPCRERTKGASEREERGGASSARESLSTGPCSCTGGR